MAKQSAPFSSLPRNLSVERRNLRTARVTGLVRPAQPNTRDAFRVVSAAVAYKQAFDDNKTTIPFFGELSDAWAARKDWRP
jgi:hypothetical protein